MQIESPFAGKTKEEEALNRHYLEQCIKDSLERGEAPFASHKMYTDCLDDSIPEQRRLGIEAGFAYLQRADLVAVYTDRGISPGMKAAIEKASELRLTVTFREILTP